MECTISNVFHFLRTLTILCSILIIVTPTEGDDDPRTPSDVNVYHQGRINGDSRFKVEKLGGVLKKHIHKLRNTRNQKVDIIFLVDSSSSVGQHNFRDELKFVKKLLSDFTVDSNHTRVSLVTFSSRTRVVRQLDYIAGSDRYNKHKCSLLEEDIPKITYRGGGTYTYGAFIEAKVGLSLSERYKRKFSNKREI